MSRLDLVGDLDKVSFKVEAQKFSKSSTNDIFPSIARVDESNASDWAYLDNSKPTIF